MRLEVLLHCVGLGMVALDLSANYPAVAGRGEGLAPAVQHARDYFTHNCSPVGVVTLVVPFIMGAIVCAMFVRLVRERKLLDFVTAVLVALGCWHFHTNVEPVEKNLVNLAEDGIAALQHDLTVVFLGHVTLLVLLFVGIILSLFSTPPTRFSRWELLPVWAGFGMNILNLTFDLPVILDATADPHFAFVNNTIHQDTFIHEKLVPIIFAIFFFSTFLRVARHRNFKDIAILLLTMVASVVMYGLVEPEEHTMKLAGSPSVPIIKVLGASHAAFLVLTLVATALALSAQADLEQAHKPKRA
eukprot:CAMPEP_0177647900 /NCGR_PEP_ID=MMETSP0447-20121125/10543_1 /TAXON_ID=0 /ORGANISM="Stygamoeba regulata, Strain BSH-02190019" /LENGTH=300 /DNA_ID=CAMNT_0019150509 /DNA_START=22 /DNA_END=924 /DNA_ORIENTATION=+